MKLVCASHNKGKIKEFQELLAPLGIEILSLSDIDFEGEIEETGETFAENAVLKAEEVYHFCGLPTFADDSGLCVDALDGAPGVFSARFGGEDITDEARSSLLLEELADVPEEARTAHFICSLAVILGDDDKFLLEATCDGHIGRVSVGTDGFGYDPIFFVGDRSFAELSHEEKNEISHRGKVVRALREEFLARKEKGNKPSL